MMNGSITSIDITSRKGGENKMLAFEITLILIVALFIWLFVPTALLKAFSFILLILFLAFVFICFYIEKIE